LETTTSFSRWSCRFGLPLLFLELKATHKHLKNAYDDNLRDYKTAIAQIFVPNAFLMLSNGSQTKVGSISAEWEHFFEWKRINDEGETGVVSLETAIRGLCDKKRFLDYVENFVLYEKARGGFIKKIAKNHQFLGVNQSIAKMGALAKAAGTKGLNPRHAKLAVGAASTLAVFLMETHNERPK
jgi:type I restriction enzyme R subunit